MKPEPAKNVNWRQAKKFVIFCSVILFFIFSFFWFFRSLQIPIIFSLFLTYLLSPVVEKLDKYKIPRLFVVSAMVALSVTLLTFIVIRLFPVVYTQVMDIVNQLPIAFQTISAKWLPTIRDLVVRNELMDRESFDSTIANFNIGTQIAIQIENAFKTIWTTVPKVLGSVVNIVFVPLLTFFFLKDIHGLINYFNSLVPQDVKKPLRSLVRKTDDTLKLVIKGQATVALILGVLYMIGFSITGLKAALVIGLVAGICRIIPYLDVVVGGTLAGVVLVSESAGWPQISAVIGVFAFVQALDGMFITPRVVGERVGLHPLVVIISVIAFGDMFGFWGVLIAIPTVAIAKNFWSAVIPFYLVSPAFIQPYRKRNYNNPSRKSDNSKNKNFNKKPSET